MDAPSPQGRRRPAEAREPRVESCNDAALAALREVLTGTLFFPGEAGYELTAPWNVAVPVRPRAVVAAADADDVIETVRFAAGHGLRVAVLGTGHGAVPIEGDVVLVHTGRLDRCDIDSETHRALVGAGATWQQVLDATSPLGLAVLCGSSTTVGVAGYLTGGGIGPLVRTFGVSSDHVQALEVVTGDARLLRVTADDHPDLFWGLRGGKATLGIVTAVEMELLTLSTVYGGALYFDGADAPAVLDAWRAWCSDLPEEANTSLALLQLPPLPSVPPPLAGRMSVAVRYTSVLAPDDAEVRLAPIRAAATPLLDAVGVLPYAAIGSVHSDPAEPLPALESGGLLTELPPAAVDALLAVAGPDSGSPQTLVELRLLGGAMGRPAAHPSAFSHREAAFNLAAIGALPPPNAEAVGALTPPNAEAVEAHAAELMEAMQPWLTGGVLPNFAPSSDQGRNARCYDEPTLERLRQLADDYDPAGVFRVGQVVRSDHGTD